MLTFSKTSIVTKLSLSAHPSKGPQFLPFNPNPWTVLGLIDMAFEIKKKKKKKITGSEGERRKTQHCKLTLNASNSKRIVIFMAVSTGSHSACCFSHSTPSRSMSLMEGCKVDAIRLFEFQRRKDTCTMYAELLRCTGYTWIAALTQGKSQESGNPRRVSQSAG